MKKRGEKVHGLNDDQIRRLQDLKPHYNYGDYGTIAELTGNSRDYVRKVLDPNFPRWNESIVETATNIIRGRLEEQVKQAERARLFLLNN